MNFKVEEQSDKTVVTVLSENLDMTNVHRFRNGMRGIVQESRKLIVDMSRVTFIDSAGLCALVNILKELREINGDLSLRGLSRSAGALCELSRMNMVVDMLSSMDDPPAS